MWYHLDAASIVRLLRCNGVQDDMHIDVAVPWLEALPLYIP